MLFDLLFEVLKSVFTYFYFWLFNWRLFSAVATFLFFLLKKLLIWFEFLTYFGIFFFRYFFIIFLLWWFSLISCCQRPAKLFFLNEIFLPIWLLGLCMLILLNMIEMYNRHFSWDSRHRPLKNQNFIHILNFDFMLIVIHFWVLTFRSQYRLFQRNLITLDLILLVSWTFIQLNYPVVADSSEHAIYLFRDIYFFYFFNYFFSILFIMISILLKLDFQAVLCLLLWWVFETLRIMLRVVFHEAFWGNGILKNVFVDFGFAKIVQSALRCWEVVLEKYL